MHYDKNIFFKVHDTTIDNHQIFCRNLVLKNLNFRNWTFHVKRLNNATLLRVSSRQNRPLILPRRLRRVFTLCLCECIANVCVHARISRRCDAHKQTRKPALPRKTEALPLMTSTTQPAPHLPRLPLFIDVVSKEVEETEEKIERTRVWKKAAPWTRYHSS